MRQALKDATVLPWRVCVDSSTMVPELGARSCVCFAPHLYPHEGFSDCAEKCSDLLGVDLRTGGQEVVADAGSRPPWVVFAEEAVLPSSITGAFPYNP